MQFLSRTTMILAKQLIEHILKLSYLRWRLKDALPVPPCVIVSMRVETTSYKAYLKPHRAHTKHTPLETTVYSPNMHTYSIPGMNRRIKIQAGRPINVDTRKANYVSSAFYKQKFSGNVDQSIDLHFRRFELCAMKHLLNDTLKVENSPIHWKNQPLRTFKMTLMSFLVHKMFRFEMSAHSCTLTTIVWPSNRQTITFLPTCDWSVSWTTTV